jgi:hypothetical protein
VEEYVQKSKGKIKVCSENGGKTTYKFQVRVLRDFVTTLCVTFTLRDGMCYQQSWQDILRVVQIYSMHSELHHSGPYGY